MEFLKASRLEKTELESGHRFRRQGLDLLLDFERQRAEFCFHLPQGRPPLALFDASTTHVGPRRVGAAVMRSPVGPSERNVGAACLRTLTWKADYRTNSASGNFQVPSRISFRGR